MLDEHQFSNLFRVRALTESDAQIVLNLYQTNPYFFEHCPPSPSLETVLSDMRELPTGKDKQDKHFVGYFDHEDKLVAVLDLVERYPDEKTVFIGLFMIDKVCQGKGLGSRLIVELLNAVSNYFDRVRLGYVETNEVAVAFWQKLHFIPTGEQSQTEYYNIIVADYMIRRTEKCQKKIF